MFPGDMVRVLTTTRLYARERCFNLKPVVTSNILKDTLGMIIMTNAWNANESTVPQVMAVFNNGRVGWIFRCDVSVVGSRS